MSQSLLPRILQRRSEIRCLFQISLRTVSDVRQAAGFVCTFLSAFFQLTGIFGGASIGCTASVGGLQASN
jgi:hypothetical protein